MSKDIQNLIPEYVKSRRDIVKKISELKAEQDRIHQELRLNFTKKLSVISEEWLKEDINKYITAGEQYRRDLLETLIEQFRYVDPDIESIVGQIRNQALKVSVRDGQIGLDLTTLVSMRNSVSFAIESMMKYTDEIELEDADDIMREARSYEKNQNKPIDYIEGLAAPVLEGTIILERPDENEVVTISITEFSKRQQEIIHLLVNEGKSYSQIAEELGISKDSVAEHIKMARKKALKLKEKHGVQQAFRGVINEAPVATTEHRQVARRTKRITIKVGEQLTIEV